MPQFAFPFSYLNIFTFFICIFPFFPSSSFPGRVLILFWFFIYSFLKTSYHCQSECVTKLRGSLIRFEMALFNLENCVAVANTRYINAAATFFINSGCANVSVLKICSPSFKIHPFLIH